VSHYKYVAIQSFKNSGDASDSPIRARPLSGQGFDTSMYVECSSKMRKKYPVGTVFIVQAQIIEKEGWAPFLYTHYNWPYKVISLANAKVKIKNKSLSSSFII
jgi:hypothetical protein